MKISALIYSVTIFIVIGLLFGCLEQGTVTNNYVNQPAIVRSDDGGKQIETMLGLFGIISESVSEGDSLITDFKVDPNSQLSSVKYPVASDFRSVRVHSSEVKISSGSMVNSFNDSIISVELYYNFVDSVLFFNIKQKIGRYQPADYELICNTDSDQMTTNGTIIKRLYIKGRKFGLSTGKDTTFIIPYAFKMDEFVNKFTDSNKDSIVFNINYLYGDNKYKIMKDSTIVWSPSGKFLYSKGGGR